MRDGRTSCCGVSSFTDRDDNAPVVRIANCQAHQLGFARYDHLLTGCRGGSNGSLSLADLYAVDPSAVW